MKRHTCIICGAKRYEEHMKNVFGNSWACAKSKYYFQSSVCCEHEEIKDAIKVKEIVKNWKHLNYKHLQS